MAANTQAPPSVDLVEIVGTEDVAIERLLDVRRSIHCSIDLRGEMERLLESFGTISRKLSSDNKVETRKGTAQWLLGRSRAALTILEQVRPSRESAVVAALAALELGLYAKAEEHLQKAKELEGDTPVVLGALAEVHLKLGRVDDAQTLIDRFPKSADGQADTHYLKGLVADFQGDEQKAVDQYQKALDVDPAHARSLFRLAFLYDLHGDDDRAYELYERLYQQRPLHVNSVMNLGLSFEDRADYVRAIGCYEQVLDADPTHGRARLFLEDAKASLNMYYDEELMRKEQKLAQLLATPCTDFQLTVRAQNCLEKSTIKTLGDLVSKTEEELLEVPNFGQASLKEIKEMLASRGLALSTTKGKPVHPRDLVRMQDQAEKEGILAKPVTDFEWSERIRKAFEKLKVRTIGEVTARTEQDFLSCENFGQTSLKELKKRLSGMGLSLKTD